MSIFAQGSPEEYLQHIIVVLHLINQKGLDKQCKEYNKEMASATLGVLKQNSIGPAESSSKKDHEKAQTQEMHKASTKWNNEAVAATYELLHNLLAIKLQTQWDCIVVMGWSRKQKTQEKMP